MFLHVVNASYVGDYSLQLIFSDGVIKDVDLAGELYGEVFEPLKDPAFFAKAAVNPDTNTVEWPNGADFAPEFLYEVGTTVQPSAQAVA
ncbi:MAG: DUF2442 domain-containing protein [Anaerolineae bacterium]